MKPQKDKPERFLQHLKPLQGVLEGFCRRWLYDESLAEDVLQEAVTKAFGDFDLFAEGTNFRAWIFKYVHLGVLETNRLTRRRPHVSLAGEPAIEEGEGWGWELDFDESLLEVLLERPEVVLQQCGDALSAAVRQLKPIDRSVLLLKAIGGFKYREIAEIVEVPLGTVMSSLSRARQRVRHELIVAGRECLTRSPQEEKNSRE